MKSLQLEKPVRVSKPNVKRNHRTAIRQPHPDLSGETNLARFKSLLVPTDFSKCSLVAVKYADQLAGANDGSIDLLNVLDPERIPEGLRMPHADWEALMVRNAFRSLEQIAREQIADLTPVHSEVRIGSSYGEICAAAEHHNADLIVIGTHGRVGLKRLFLGSTAELVVRHAPCSVLTVHELDANPSGEWMPKRILVPVDFSHCSNEAIRAAISLARQFQASLNLVHVIPAHYANGEYDSVNYTLLETELREAAQKDLADLTRTIAAEGLKVGSQILLGRQGTQIIETAQAHKSDLIIISTHGRTGLKNVLLGSVTEQVVRHATCPVLTLRGQK